ncbi:transcriptional regulator [Anaerocolumna cellulosilytica]|uniref:Transcriptional regulator n=1 Tax=Anaerocolumna cellulosilytica TaxID=433286 RepID=A0A6S6QN06_9FIRM|nr:helix-turn-helix transcriptional regulator [Anaerocolumna cellulosilytica]MBB5197291.1 transcriptional regulator with XRE-family HTH domain [Anaerocolumna cellulosilytica]BCJ92733.1 transcriptional regulator [Anaerocolumna cellulosilytica]
MNYEHFGAFLHDLRIQHNFSREQLAENICTTKQIYRIEKGVSEPSLYLITQLSIKFNMDLHEYYKMHFTNKTLIGLEGVKYINSAIESGDLLSLKTLMEKYEKVDDFKKGRNLQYIYYGKALCSALLDSNYNASLDYCIKGIKLEFPKFNLDNISKNMYSNVGIALLNCISQNYFALDEPSNGAKVLFELLTVLETHIINSPYPMFQVSDFSKKIYQAVLCNISSHLLNNGENIKALSYVEKGIQYSIKEYNIRFLPDLFIMKCKILYNEQNYIESKDYYERASYLYRITNKDKKLIELEESVRIDFPEIFNY